MSEGARASPSTHGRHITDLLHTHTQTHTCHEIENGCSLFLDVVDSSCPVRRPSACLYARQQRGLHPRFRKAVNDAGCGEAPQLSRREAESDGCKRKLSGQRGVEHNRVIGAQHKRVASSGQLAKVMRPAG